MKRPSLTPFNLRATTAAVMTCALLGCGGGDDGSSPTSPPPAPPAPQPDPPPPTSPSMPLLFQSGRGDGGLFKMSEDGGAITQVAGADAQMGDFSPDGSKIVYWDRISNLEGDIVVAESDGSNPVIVHAWQAPDAAGGSLGSPSWSPDGLRILFKITEIADSCGDTDSDFYTVGPDGTDFSKLLDSECGSANFKPTFSPDGTQIVFASKRERGGTNSPILDIFVMNVDGLGLRRLTDGPEGGFSPVWSPDGKQIVFGLTTAGEVWVTDVEEGAGPPEMLLQLPDAFQIDPGGWSPDGSKVYLTVWWPGFSADVHVLDLGSGQLTALTTESERFDGHVRRSMVAGS